MKPSWNARKQEMEEPMERRKKKIETETDEWATGNFVFVYVW